MKARLFILSLLLLVGVQQHGYCAASPSKCNLVNVSITGLGENLSVTLDWLVYGADVPGCDAVIYEPVIRGGDAEELYLTPVVSYSSRLAKEKELLASGDPRELKVMFLNEGEVFSSKDLLERKSWMDNIRLYVNVYTWSKRNGKRFLSSSIRGRYSRPRRPGDPVFPWDPVVPVEDRKIMREGQYRTPFVFSGSSSKVDLTIDGNKDALDSLSNRLKYLTSEKKFNVSDLSIIVYLSPDIEVSSGFVYGKACAKSLQGVLQSRGCFKYIKPEIVDGMIDMGSVRKWFIDSDYANDRRLHDLIFSGDDKVKESLRREKPGAWDYMCESVFPPLRRVVVSYNFQKKRETSYDFASEIASTFPGLLSPLDIWLLSSRYEYGSEDWISVVEKYIQYCPEDSALCKDLTMAYIQLDNPRAASSYVRHCGADDQGKYVYAVWLYNMERYEECLEILSELKEKSALYSGIWNVANTYITWLLGYGDWVKTFS